MPTELLGAFCNSVGLITARSLIGQLSSENWCQSNKRDETREKAKIAKNTKVAKKTKIAKSLKKLDVTKKLFGVS